MSFDALQMLGKTQTPPPLSRSFHFVLPGDEQLVEDARCAAGTDKPLLIIGEQGTGKSVLARYIHDQSARRDAPFVEFCCADYAPEHVVPELLGRAPDAYSGATVETPGAIHSAEGGTLLLREPGATGGVLFPLIQSWLSSGQVRTPGSSSSRPVSARLIVSAHEDIREAGGTSFWRRLKEWPPMHMTPLRVQRRKKWLLFKRFIEEALGGAGQAAPELIDLLLYFFVVGYEWPGNAGQVRHFAEFLVESGMFEDRTIRLDPEFSFFDDSDSMSSHAEGRGGTTGLTATAGERFFRNRVHWDFIRVLRVLQNSQKALAWRDVSRATPGKAGRWEYPRIRWSDPHFDGQECCAQLGQEHSQALARVLDEDRRTPQAPLYRTADIPWDTGGTSTTVAHGRTDADLADQVAFAMLTGAIADKDAFMQRVFAAIIRQAPDKTQREYQELGIPKTRLKDLLKSK